MTTTKLSISQLNPMTVPAAVEVVTASSLWRLIWHPTLTIFVHHRGNMWRKDCQMIGRWLIALRDEVQS